MPRKNVKKAVKKPKKEPLQARHELVVRVTGQESPVVDPKDLEPIKGPRGNYTLVPSALKAAQVLKISEKTPPQHIRRREGKGGKQFEYVTIGYIKRVLDYAFGWMWSFDILKIEEMGGQIVCQGKLSIQDHTGKVILWKTDIGNADIKRLKATKEYLDYGNDMKAAISDCIKRCASQLGIARDIYSRNEFSDLDGSGNQPQAPATPIDGKYKCVGWDNKIGCPGDILISEQQHNYSQKIYGKDLCSGCQLKVKELEGKK